ncbi:hypothetical protein MXB_325, partial [Myxobolus squamalis]
SQILNPLLLKSLCDKSIERRKFAASEITRRFREIKNDVDGEFIEKSMNKISVELLSSSISLHRRGGIIALYSAVNGLGNACKEYLEKIFPPLIACFTDQDASVRMLACEGTSNIPFSSYEFLIIVAGCRLRAVSQRCCKRLDPANNEIKKSPDGLNIPGLMDILLIHAHSIDDSIKLVAINWISSILTIYTHRVYLFVPSILNVIIPCLQFDMKCKALLECCYGVNEKLKILIQECSQNDNSISIDFELLTKILKECLNQSNEAAKMIVLDWVQHLLNYAHDQFYEQTPLIFNSLIDITQTDSIKVINLAIKILCRLSISNISGIQCNDNLIPFLRRIISNLAKDKCSQLKSQGSLIVSTICQSLSPILVYTKLAEVIIEGFEKSPKISTIVHTLNIIMLTAEETRDLRLFLVKSGEKEKIVIFTTIYKCWAHNPVSALSLCLISGRYQLSYDIVEEFQQIEPSVELLMQIDHLIQLIESPNFT